jgi:hypothetical protein
MLFGSKESSREIGSASKFGNIENSNTFTKASSSMSKKAGQRAML